MTPERISAFATASAIGLFVLLLAFNLGRLDAAAKARQCPQEASFQIPFKGTFND